MGSALAPVRWPNAVRSRIVLRFRRLRRSSNCHRQVCLHRGCWSSPLNELLYPQMALFCKFRSVRPIAFFLLLISAGSPRFRSLRYRPERARGCLRSRPRPWELGHAVPRALPAIVPVHAAFSARIGEIAASCRQSVQRQLFLPVIARFVGSAELGAFRGLI